MTKAQVPQRSGNMATADILTDFGRFLRLYVADGDASPETIRSYYGNAAQFVAWYGEHGRNPATVTEDDMAIYQRELVAQYEVAPLGAGSGRWHLEVNAQRFALKGIG